MDSATAYMPFRQQLRELGLTPASFARTLVNWGDSRTFENLRRIVQRAAEDDASLHEHFALAVRIAIDHIKRRNLLRRQLRLFESHHMSMGYLSGNDERVDMTEVFRNELVRQKDVLDGLLKELHPSTHVFASASHKDRFAFAETEDALGGREVAGFVETPFRRF